MKHPDYPIELRSADTTIIVNEYWLTLSGLNPEPFVCANDWKWLLVVAAHRDNFTRFKKWHELRNQIRETVRNQNILIGAISNDRFFSAFERFLAGSYTDDFTIRVAQLINYPAQYVLKSDLACEKIEYITHYQVMPVEHQRYRDLKASNRSLEGQRIRDLVVSAIADGTFYNGRLFIDVVSEVYDSGGFEL